ncbi:hypothetical protein, conserved [Eimeria tenella]|uniref:Uncharacterized protein n=1 Tax=Eimeria tenella TaxID=5802 RepID=U6L3A6_EIMTE|nr:hypothetical protein, conserved [Eimeria tenella]CDJ42250.1 hypothetical protein, conserved [Eimeria tenella]|eukprot:XP_013233000.1 hypothetical protein, conserved [Eimeria tenella]
MRWRTAYLCRTSCLLLCIFTFSKALFASSARPRKPYGAAVLSVPSVDAPLGRPQPAAANKGPEFSFAEAQKGFPSFSNVQDNEERSLEELQGAQGPDIWGGAGSGSSTPQARQQPHGRRRSRLRRVFQNVRRRAAEKMRRLWRGIRRGAARLKAGARRAARAIFRRLPVLRRRQRGPKAEPEAPQPSLTAPAGLAGLGVAAAAALPAAAGAATAAGEAAGEPSAPEAQPPVEPAAESPPAKELEKEEREAEPQTETPPSSPPESDEFVEALTPEAYRALYPPSQPEKEEDAAAAVPAEAPPAAPPAAPAGPAEPVPEDCAEFLLEFSDNLKWVNDRAPELCALWSLFAREPNISRGGTMEPRAFEISKQISEAKLLEPADSSFNATKLRVTLDLAQAEDGVARAGKYTDDFCWFTRPESIMKRLSPEEKEAADEVTNNYVGFLRNPCTVFDRLMRHMDVAEVDANICVEKAEEEIKVREVLKEVLMAQRNRLEEAVQSLNLTPHQMRVGNDAIKDLQQLSNRESCSMEILHITKEHAKNIKTFIIDYKANGHHWWKVQWPGKIAGIMPSARGSKIVPPHVAKECRAYENSKQPSDPSEVTELLEWFWEVALLRSEAGQQ